MFSISSHELLLDCACTSCKVCSQSLGFGSAAAPLLRPEGLHQASSKTLWIRCSMACVLSQNLAPFCFITVAGGAGSTGEDSSAREAGGLLRRSGLGWWRLSTRCECHRSSCDSSLTCSDSATGGAGGAGGGACCTHGAGGLGGRACAAGFGGADGGAGIAGATRTAGRGGLGVPRRDGHRAGLPAARCAPASTVRAGMC